LRLLVRGAANDLIAWARGSTLRTVANQVAAVLAKTGAMSRYELSFAFADADLGPGQFRPGVREAKTTSTLLLAEDEPDAANELAALFRARGFAVTVTSTVEETRAALPAHDVAVVDVVLGDGKATELVAGSTTPIVLISGRATFEDVAWGLANGATEFFAKSSPIDTLFGAVGDATTRNATSLVDIDVSPAALADMTPIARSVAGVGILAGELRCVLEAEWTGIRRVVLETIAEPQVLPSRVREIARLASSGLPMKRIATNVKISEATAWLDLKRFLAHAGLRDRVHLARTLGATS
jgi:DNA-binding NarL/FixJ family response regulator